MQLPCIPGPTLEKHCRESKPDILTALSTVIRLAKIVQFCHERDVVHRDIKPDNIILRGGVGDAPVLLDFGLSFNKSVEQDTITFASQQLGNRFLHLPELLTESGNRRDPRSDCTQCCGVLFYLITGRPPTVLNDSEGRKPHQRPSIPPVSEGISETQRALLLQLFDTGFEQEISRRFQSAKAFISALETVLEGKMKDTSKLEKQLAEIQSAINLTPDYRKKEDNKKLIEQLRRVVSQSCDTVNRGVGTKLGFGTRISHADKVQLAPFYFEATRYVHHELFANREAVFQVSCGLAGDEYVLFGRSQTDQVELVRFAVQGPVDWTMLQTRISEFIAGVIAKLFVP